MGKSKKPQKRFKRLIDKLREATQCDSVTSMSKEHYIPVRCELKKGHERFTEIHTGNGLEWNDSVPDTAAELFEPLYLITLEKPEVEEDGPKVVCGCGWETPYSTNLIGLGNAAKKHSEDTGHLLRAHSE